MSISRRSLLAGVGAVGAVAVAGLPTAAEKVSAIEFVGELPPGEWMVASFNDVIVFACPEHAPRILRDGRIELFCVHLPEPA